MRKNAVLIAGFLLVTALAGVDHARAAGQTPWLGVYMQELTHELREGIGYRGDGGVILTAVVADGPAARAGLRRGDVVVRVDSRTVDSPAELQDIVRTARVGKSVSVEAFRAGERRIVSVWLAARPGEVKHGLETREAPEAPEAPEVPEAPEASEPPVWRTNPSPDGQRHVKRIVIRDLKGLEGLEGLKELDLPGGFMGALGTASRGRLGVRIESLNPKLGDYFGLKDGKGVLVLEVLKDTPAERAALEAGGVRKTGSRCGSCATARRAPSRRNSRGPSQHAPGFSEMSSETAPGSRSGSSCGGRTAAICDTSWTS
jgi:membrane-associated protease RseP (regulator of RpoE activity)